MPFAALLLTAFACAPADQVTRSRTAEEDPGDPILNELNTLRRDPRAYAAHLERRRDFYRGTLLRLPGQTPVQTREGRAALEEAIGALQRTPALPALTWSSPLGRAADAHVRDIGPRGLTSHHSSDRTPMATRLRGYLPRVSTVAEVITFGPSAARDVVIDLLVDDGVANRGHRKLLLDARFRQVGTACGPHAGYRTVCVVDLAGSS